ncbi:hypothetical protein [Streptomyces sp. R02]|uniref:Uncharacterized protein n=1 Tax=Streptomyces sp. R02 TaxID=3238623 RepID=A0AB39LRI0_9ACTN
MQRRAMPTAAAFATATARLPTARTPGDGSPPANVRLIAGLRR